MAALLERERASPHVARNRIACFDHAAPTSDVFELSPIGMATVSQEGRWLDANAACSELLGRSRAELEGSPLEQLVHPKDLAEVLRQRTHVIEGDAERCAAQVRLLRRDGQFVVTQLNCRMMRDAQGRPLHFLYVLEDIRSDQQAQGALRRNEARLSSLLALSSDWYWEQDEQFRFVSFAGGRRSNEWDALMAAALGKRRWELPDFVPVSGSWDEHRRVLEQLLPFDDLRLVHGRHGASPRYVSVSGEPVFDVDGRFIGYRGVARDITSAVLSEQEVARLNAVLEERVALRTRELETLNRDLEAFSYSVAHDLRAPLRTIEGFARILETEAASQLGARGVHCLERVRAAARHMSDLTDALLALAHAARVPLRCERVDLAALARDALQGCRERDPARWVEACIAEDLWVAGDPTLLGQVMQNLIANAWKFTAAQTCAVINFGRRRAESGCAPAFYVRDNGPGFDMADADSLFQPFVRLHAAGAFEGSGIGLAVVNRIVARHGGRIWAESQPGHGATFFFTLPALDLGTYASEP